MCVCVCVCVCVCALVPQTWKPDETSSVRVIPSSKSPCVTLPVEMVGINAVHVPQLEGRTEIQAVACSRLDRGGACCFVQWCCCLTMPAWLTR